MLHKSLVRRLDLITLMELEQVLGVSLFMRRAKGMDLTAADIQRLKTSGVVQ